MSLLGLACGSSLPTGTGGTAGSGSAGTGTASAGTGGSGTAGTGGTGTAGTRGTGATGGGDCPAPEVFSPGVCSPTFDEQVRRPACIPGHPVSTGMCGGYRTWRQGAPWVMDILDGYQITCVYQPDGTGALVGQRVCTTNANIACMQVNATIFCHTSGFVPINPANEQCQADGGATDPAPICPSDGGAPG